jgi:SAM-dependent methyltransferase
MRVDPSLLLVGAQGGHDAVAFASATGLLGLGSTPMDRSPHVGLLHDAIECGRPLTDDELRASAYWAFAHRVAEIDGSWFGARSDSEYLDVTRNFIDWALERSPRVTGSAGTRFEDNILVAAISGSPMFQIIDGHHRVAKAIARGDTSLRVDRTWLGTETPLQRRLLRLNANERRLKTLRQPVPARDVETGWLVASDCTDRLLRMVHFLEQLPDDDVPPRTYLDVGSSYGWYLGKMKQFGFSVLGVEPEAGAVEVGTSFYEIEPDEVVVGEPIEFVERMTGSFDVVSCFGLLSAFDGSSGRDEAGRLIKAMDGVVDRVLFVDSDEDPTYAALPPGANPASLTRLILDTTSFRQAVDLGDNHDPVGPWSASTSSRLIALVR